MDPLNPSDHIREIKVFNLYQMGGDFKNACRCARLGLVAASKHEAAHSWRWDVRAWRRQLATVLIGDLKYDDAIVITNELLQHPDSGFDRSNVLLIRGRAYFGQQRYKEALLDATEADRRTHPRSDDEWLVPKAIKLKAACLKALGQKNEAAKILTALETQTKKQEEPDW